MLRTSGKMFQRPNHDIIADNFALHYDPYTYLGVNSQSKLVTLALGLCPEQHEALLQSWTKLVETH